MPLLLPAEGEGGSEPSLVQQIRRSCKQTLEDSSVVAIDYGVAKRFAESLVESQVREAAAGNVRLPLQFPDRSSEVNVLMLLHFLSFGSGYEPMLQIECKASADEVMKFGVLGMYISGSNMGADFFKNFSDFQVSNFFRIPTHVEVPSEMHPAIHVSQPGPLMPLARAIREQLQQLGNALQEAGTSSAGDYVIQQLKTTTSASEAIAALSRSLPGFRDCGTDADPGPVLYSKAQSLLAVLCQRFGVEGQEDPFISANVKHELTASADNVLPGILRHLGILQVSDEVSSAIESGEDSSAWAADLRAAAVVAVEFLAEEAAAELSPREVEAYLRLPSVVPVDDLKLPLVRDTVFY